MKGLERADLSKGSLAISEYRKAQELVFWGLTGNIDTSQVTLLMQKGRRHSFPHYLYLQNCPVF